MITYEDELPSNLSQAEYDRWYDQSKIVDGVRVGPSLKRITYSIESLFHFKCGNCLKWWTIGGWDGSADSMCCPHCEVRSEVEKEDT